MRATPAHLALPPPRPSRPIKGRHLRRRRRAELARRGGVVVAVILMLAGLVELGRVLNSSTRSAGENATTVGLPASTPSARPSAQPPPGSGVLGNLVLNWSFEQDLRGWTVLGPADGDRQVGGRTSGSAARIDAKAGAKGAIGLALPAVVTDAQAGKHYTATVWIQSTNAGVPVTLRLVTTPPSGRPEVVQQVVQPDKERRWTKGIVAATVRTSGSTVRFEVTTTARSLVVDEVNIRED